MNDYQHYLRHPNASQINTPLSKLVHDVYIIDEDNAFDSNLFKNICINKLKITIILYSNKINETTIDSLIEDSYLYSL